MGAGGSCIPSAKFDPTGCILRLQSLNALGHIAIIDIRTVDGREMTQCRGLVLSCFAGRPQFVVDGQAGFLIESGNMKRLFIPANGGVRNSFIEEALGQPGVSLDGLRKWLAA